MAGDGVSGSKLVRIDQADFTSSGVTVLDMTSGTSDIASRPDLVGFGDMQLVGGYVYLLPGEGVYGRPGDDYRSGKMARVSTASFDANGVDVLDLTDLNPHFKGFQALSHADGKLYFRCLNKDAAGTVFSKLIRISA